MMKKMVILYIVFAIGLITLGCPVPKAEKIAEFRTLKEKGDKFIILKQYEDADKKYTAAYTIAKDLNWPTGIAISSIDRADILIAKKNFTEAESILLNGKNGCVADIECSQSQLIFLYDSLFYLYLRNLNNPDKACDILKELILNKTIFNDQKDLESRLNRYALDLENAGYSDAAANLRTDIKALYESN